MAKRTLRHIRLVSVDGATVGRRPRKTDRPMSERLRHNLLRDWATMAYSSAVIVDDILNRLKDPNICRDPVVVAALVRAALIESNGARHMTENLVEALGEAGKQRLHN